ncbi:type VI secretion system protein TssL, long form [Mesorhizobium sp. CC13]|uniref:type VI secretion system protein TssL, long form n=1 Tax=Mesorhizobium sp. CC13 TaxID=3029194 RepID=UPI0032664F5C
MQRPSYDIYHRVDFPASNPLIAAAAPLLMMLGRLRLAGPEAGAEELGRHLGELVDTFDHSAAEADVADEDARIAKYVLCETADDIAGNLPGIGRDAWQPHSLLRRFYQLEAPGNGFLDALNSVLGAPEERCDLLELMHACLSLGFEGPYRGTARGGQSLEPVRQDVFNALRYFRPRDGIDLSPRWQGQSTATARRSRRLPLWAIAAAAIAAVTGAFFWMRAEVTDEGEALAGRLLALAPAAQVTIERAMPAPPAEEEPAPPVTSQIERIRGTLAPDIESGALKVDPRGDFIVVAIDNRLLFEPGGADTKPEFAPVAARIGAALQAEQGPVRIVGHTDNLRPGRTSPFKSNYDLSVARAQAVATLLAPLVGDPSRITVEGKGEDEPIADNALPEGRAKNRRVDVMIRREASQ